MDWSLAAEAPPALDFAWFLDQSARFIDATREQLIEDFRAAEGDQHDETTLRLALLAELVLAGWQYRGIVEADDPAGRATRQAELDWWLAAARSGLEAWQSAVLTDDSAVHSPSPDPPPTLHRLPTATFGPTQAVVVVCLSLALHLVVFRLTGLMARASIGGYQRSGKDPPQQSNKGRPQAPIDHPTDPAEQREKGRKWPERMEPR